MPISSNLPFFDKINIFLSPLILLFPRIYGFFSNQLYHGLNSTIAALRPLYLIKSINEGKSSNIFKTAFGVQKISKKKSNTHNVMTQRLIHQKISEILDSSAEVYSILRVPKLSSDLAIYEMSLIDASNPFFLGDTDNCATYAADIDLDRVAVELASLWRAMWVNNGYALYDFELYKQSDGTVIILDFDSTGVRVSGSHNHRDGIQIPGLSMSRQPDPETFFSLSPCYPKGFETNLQDLSLSVGCFFQN